jgi:hypothetical protein
LPAQKRIERRSNEVLPELWKENVMSESKIMSVSHIAAAGSVAVSGGLTFLGLGLIENVGVIDPISAIEKLGIAAVVMVFGYLIVKYLLKQNESLKAETVELRSRIESFHDERVLKLNEYTERNREQLNEIKLLLENQKRK